jgi:peptidoglycan LD-endopeptidase LytH
MAKKFFVVAYVLGLHFIAGYAVADWLFAEEVHAPEMASFAPPITEVAQPTPTPTATPAVVPETTPTVAVVPDRSSKGLIVPVAGVTADKLRDTFNDGRSGGRKHDAIDIEAPVGTPVLAAADGKIVKFHDSVAGGITIYQSSVDGKFMYYYAHLQRRADDLREGDSVTQGRVIGYVGDSGNATPGNYHLHFSISAVADPKRFWEGTYIDPYPLLLTGTAP